MWLCLRQTYKKYNIKSPQGSSSHHVYERSYRRPIQNIHVSTRPFKTEMQRKINEQGRRSQLELATIIEIQCIVNDMVKIQDKYLHNHPKYKEMKDTIEACYIKTD
jgi:hypothetical protein